MTFDHSAKGSACSVSVSGICGEGDRRDGRCTWCGTKFLPALPCPRLPLDFVSELSAAYRYIYDPDWGMNRNDV